MGTLIHMEGRERHSAKGSNTKRLKPGVRTAGGIYYFPYEGGGYEIDDTADTNRNHLLLEVV